jgi:hypothetical protein
MQSAQHTAAIEYLGGGHVRGGVDNDWRNKNVLTQQVIEVRRLEVVDDVFECGVVWSQGCERAARQVTGGGKGNELR